LRFAFASCQHFEQGFYTAYAGMVADDPGVIVHLGDYIYEGAAKADAVRQHRGGKLASLDSYRDRQHDGSYATNGSFTAIFYYRSPGGSFLY
jgi:alkaline phosphatase D